VSVALAYGACLGLAGVVGAAAVRARHRERLFARLGGPPYLRSAKAPGRLAARATRLGWPGSGLTYGVALAAAALTGTLLGFRVAGPVGSLAGFAGAPLALEAALARRVRRGQARSEEQLRDAVATLAAGARAGLSLRQSLLEAAGEAEPPLRGALEEALRRLSLGEPLDRALASLAAAIGSPDAALVVTLLQVHRRTGGNLPALLEEVAETVGQRTAARRQLRALTAQGRASGTVLAVLPIAFVILLSWTGGDGLGAFYRTAQGSLLLLAGLVCEGLGFAWIRRIVRSSP
jgi:tight adherence protein B